MEKRKVNKVSLLLNSEQNEQLFSLFPKKSPSLATAVVQLFVTEAPAHSHWKKEYTGVICFVKDYAKLSYFLRLYCLQRNDLVWEHELYDSIQLDAVRPYLLVFEGKSGIVALNFASEDECMLFWKAVTTIVKNPNRKHEKRDRGKPNVIPKCQSVDETTKFENQTNFIPSMPHITCSTKRGKDKRKKYTKADISNPTNFQHIQHVGWDNEKGLNVAGTENKMIDEFLKKAGVSEQHLNDRSTRDFIYGFVEQYMSSSEIKDEPNVQTQSTPPPVPSRQPIRTNVPVSPILSEQSQNGMQRSAPIQPPARQPPPAVPTVIPTSKNKIILRPAPIISHEAPVTQTSAPMPPPPPPPPQIPAQIQSGSSANDTRGALLESIRKGIPLKKVDPTPSTVGNNDSRTELLSEIRQGVDLRPAPISREKTASVRISDSDGLTDDLADILRRALQERGKAIQSSSDEDDKSSENDGEWD